MNRSLELPKPIPAKKSWSVVSLARLAAAAHSGAWIAVLLSLALQSLIFAPISWWPLSFVCLVPWLLFVGLSNRAPRVYAYSYLLGFLFFLINVRWMYPATGLGFLALAAYLGAYFPLTACPVRHAIRRRRLPLTLVFPLLWVGQEMLRAVVITGFPWFFLSHSLYRVLPLIQISDLVGAYGLSFVVAAVNGAVADVCLGWLASRDASLASKGRLRPALTGVLASVLVVAALGYGWYQLNRDTTSTGPRIAVLQGDYLSLVDGDEVSDETKMRHYFEMMDAAAELKPDLFLLPETPWIVYLNAEARNFYPISRESFANFQERAKRYNAVIVTGSASLVLTPNDLLTTERRYNSATVFLPSGGEPKRYDKVHVVPFGETVPFRFGKLRFLYFWMNSLMPFSGRDGKYEYSIMPGEKFSDFAFSAPSMNGAKIRFGTPICYEDVMPYVSRKFVSNGHSEKRVDLLLNISNDGWFGRGHQQPQHLAVCVFRAVENRVGIARAVNTGISGFIEPSGRLHDLVRGDAKKRWPPSGGYAVASVGIDSRYTLYSRYGDWFAWMCVIIGVVIYVDYWIARAREHGTERDVTTKR